MIERGESEEWARALYDEAVDKKDAAGFAAVFAEDATLRFGNNETLQGRAEIEAAIAQFFQAMVSLRHESEKVSRDGDTLFLEAKVTYQRHDGGVVTVPAMTVFDLEKIRGQIRARACRIYVDLAPLFASSR